jgi:hypothetical protein
VRAGGRTLAADVSALPISPRATRGLALIAVSLVALAAVIALRVRPGPGAPRTPPQAAAQPDATSSMDWISGREGWLSAFDRPAGTSTLFHTADSGRHWERLRVTRSVETPDFFDAAHGVVGSAGGTFRTSDGGRHWERLTLPSGVEGQQPLFMDAGHGWVWDPSSQGLYATSDGGGHWRRLAGAGLPDTRNPTPRVLGFGAGAQGWLVAGGGLYATADGGESWAPQPLALPNGGWTTGDRFAYGPLTIAADGRGQLLLSTAAAEWVTTTGDRGATWTATAPLPLWPANLATSPTDGSVSWAWAAGELHLTRDAGAHWTRIPIPIAWSLVRVQAVDARTVWVAASVPDALGVARWTLFVSADAGITWIPAVTPPLG